MVCRLVEDAFRHGVLLSRRLDHQWGEPGEVDGEFGHHGGEYVHAVGLAVGAGPVAIGGQGLVRHPECLSDEPGQHGRRAASVRHAQGRPYRAPADPEAAAVVAEEPAVAVDAGRGAAVGDAQGDRAGAGDQREAVGRRAGGGGEGRLDVAADADPVGGDAEASQRGGEGGAGVDVSRVLGGGGRGARESAGHGDHTGAGLHGDGLPDRLDQVVGEARDRDGQCVAGAGRALAERAPVLGGGEDGAGAGAAGVETDDEVPGEFLVQIIAHH